MENRPFLLLCVLISLLSLLLISGCAKETNNNEPLSEIFQYVKATSNAFDAEGSLALEEERMMSIEENKVELQREMIAFWKTYRENMECFALQMKALQEEEPFHTFLYAVKENALYFFDGVHIEAQGKIVEHELLSETAFFGQTQAFEWVAWNPDWFEHEACIFAGEVYDDDGRLYAELYLFCCEEEPVTDAYRIVIPLETNWYFYCEYRE